MRSSELMLTVALVLRVAGPLGSLSLSCNDLASDRLVWAMVTFAKGVQIWERGFK